jgi:DNA-binding beta-propeller fold protein YncE
MRFSYSFVTLAALLAAPSARGADILYVGDAGDNTIKAFDASDGTFLGVSDGPGVSGLAGPRGIIVRGSELLVVNQNVDQPVPGEVLSFDAATGTFLGAVVDASDPDAPFAPFGMVLGPDDELNIGNLMRKDSSSPGRVGQYDAASGAFLGELTAKGNEHHPRGVVFGPDGALYAAARDLKNGLGGTVYRFSKVNGKAEVLIDDKGGFGRLNRPDGIVFGPDGLLYVTSFRAAPGDTDSIRIYDASGQFVDKFDLFDPATEPRAFSQALLFGPDGALFVSIFDRGGLGNNLGELRQYDVATKSYVVFAANASEGGVLLEPNYMTFGGTNPGTLSYEP